MVIFARCFESGEWREWEHCCTAPEIDAIEDSARAFAGDRCPGGPPVESDYLRGAAYIFNVAFGEADSPAEGDTRVYGIRLNQIVLANYEQLRRHIVLANRA